jgi:hypothetical protein
VRLFVAAVTFIDSAAVVWFSQVYTFLFSYPWTRLLNTQRWFVSTNRISVPTCLPVRFLETPTCHTIFCQHQVNLRKMALMRCCGIHLKPAQKYVQTDKRAWRS